MISWKGDSKQWSFVTGKSARHGTKVNRHVDHVRVQEQKGDNAGLVTGEESGGRL